MQILIIFSILDYMDLRIRIDILDYGLRYTDPYSNFLCRYAWGEIIMHKPNCFYD
jgi:hypothetical protein